MLNRQQPEVILKSILRDVYTHTQLQSTLGFKGGTCLYLFYGLDRFSVDLDFNLIGSDFDADIMTNIVSKYLTIDDQRNKRFTWFWLGGYKKSFQRVKIEVNKRDYPDTYQPMDFYGLTIPTLTPDCMFAHKLCAITDRKTLQSRDLYDAHFMFTQQFPINDEIIKLRTGKPTQEYLSDVIDFIESHAKSHHILTGLGELLSEPQKNRVKDTLITDLLFDLRIRTQQ